MFRNRLVRWLARSIAALSLLAGIAVLVLLGLLWREHKTEITLPIPTGHAAV
jgi:hypothetical protein